MSTPILLIFPRLSIGSHYRRLHKIGEIPGGVSTGGKKPNYYFTRNSALPLAV